MVHGISLIEGVILMQKTRRKESGFTMIEVLISLAIFSFALLAIASMQIMSIRTNSVAASMTTANILAQSMIDRIHSDPSNVTNFAASPTINLNGWQAEVANNLPEGLGAVAVAPVSLNSNRVRVTVSWKQCDSDPDPNNKNHQVVLTTIM